MEAVHYPPDKVIIYTEYRLADFLLFQFLLFFSVPMYLYGNNYSLPNWLLAIVLVVQFGLSFIIAAYLAFTKAEFYSSRITLLYFLPRNGKRQKDIPVEVLTLVDYKFIHGSNKEGVMKIKYKEGDKLRRLRLFVPIEDAKTYMRTLVDKPEIELNFEPRYFL